MFAAIPFIMLIGCVWVYCMMVEPDIAVLPSLISFAILTYASFAESITALFYLMRVTDLIAVIGAIIAIVMTIKNSDKIYMSIAKINLSLMAIGVLAFVFLMIVTSFISNSIILFAVTFGLFAVLSNVINNVIIKTKANIQGSYTALIFALFFAGVFLFFPYFKPNFNEEVVNTILYFLKELPFADQIVRAIYTPSVASVEVLA